MSASYAQTYEVGLMLGATNYTGDIGSTNFVRPNDFAVGVIGKWNRSERHAFRASILFTEISGDDADASDNSRKIRGFEFDNQLLEINLGLEYTFWEWELYSGEPRATPYLYTGIVIFNRDELVRSASTDTQFQTDGSSWDLGIPMTIGFKFTLNRRFIMAIEAGARYTFTDGLDGSDQTGFEFGNKDNNDWYFFSGISLTYTFGKRPCYCNF